MYTHTIHVHACACTYVFTQVHTYLYTHMYIVYELVKHLHTCLATHPPSSEMTPTSLSFADTPIPVMAPEGNCIIRSGDRLCGRQSKYGTQSCHTGWWHTQGRGHMTHACKGTGTGASPQIRTRSTIPYANNFLTSLTYVRTDRCA